MYFYKYITQGCVGSAAVIHNDPTRNPPSKEIYKIHCPSSLLPSFHRLFSLTRYVMVFSVDFIMKHYKECFFSILRMFLPPKKYIK